MMEKLKMKYKSCVVVETSPSRYRVTRYTANGDVSEEYWCPTKYAANEKAKAIQGEFKLVTANREI